MDAGWPVEATRDHGAAQADTIKFGVTDITGLESLQTEYGDFVAVLEEITGDEVKFFGSSTIQVESLEFLKA